MANKESSQFPTETREREIYSECGMFAVHLRDPRVANIGSMTAQGLVTLQHRAEGATGIYLSNGSESEFLRKLGTVAVATNEGKDIPKVPNANIAIGHTRYPTSGSSRSEFNIQPLQRDGIVLAHHGNLINAQQIRDSLGEINFGGDYPDSDSWIALNAVVQAEGETLAEKVVNAKKNFEGGFAFVVSDGKDLVAARDPYGIRPLFVGMLGDETNPLGHLFSVESCAFRNFAVNQHFREVRPGETIEVSNNKISSVDYEPKGEGYCAFEYVYMMSPDSVLANKNIYKTRVRAGKNLWKEAPVELPEGKKLLVMPVPNSGRPAALGYYHQAKKELGDRVEYDERLLVNQYMGRNFIKETQNRAAKLKFYPIADSLIDEDIEQAVDENFEYLLDDNFIVVDSPRISPEFLESEYELVFVDDSTARGDTQTEVIQLGRRISRQKPHLRVIAIVKNPCNLGVATPTYQEFFVNRIPDRTEQEDYLGVKSFRGLSVDGLVASIGISKDRLCTECLDGVGPYSHSSNQTIPLQESGVLIDNS